MAVTGVVTPLRSRVAVVLIGHSAKKAEEYLFDWLIYGAVVAYCTQQYGFVWGSLLAFAIMAPLSGMLCYLYLKLYDWAQTDWFGFEALKETQDSTGILGFLVRRGRVPAFFGLSMYCDPFMTVVYLRERSHQYRGLDAKEHGIFIASVIVSNGYWTLRWAVIVEAFLWVWRYMTR